MSSKLHPMSADAKKKLTDGMPRKKARPSQVESAIISRGHAASGKSFPTTAEFKQTIGPEAE